MRLPVDAAHAGASRRLRREQVLHVAVVFWIRGGAVIEEVRQAEQLAAVLRDQGMHGFGRVEETGPGDPRDLLRQRGAPGAAIEGVVSVPEGLPGVEVLRGHASDR